MGGGEAAEPDATPGKKKPGSSVTVRDVVDAVKGLKESPQLRCLGRCTDAEALVVVSLASLLVSTGREEGGVGVAEVSSRSLSRFATKYLASQLGASCLAHASLPLTRRFSPRVCECSFGKRWLQSPPEWAGKSTSQYLPSPPSSTSLTG